DSTAAGYIRLLALVTRTLIDPGQPDAPALLSAATIRSDLGDLTSQQLFVGLLLLKEKSEFKKIFFKTKDLYTLLNDQHTANTIHAMAAWLIKMAGSYENLNTIYVKIKTQISNSKPVYSPLITGFVSSFLNTATVTLDCPVLDTAFFSSASFKGMLTKLSDLSQIASDVADSNYGLALTHIIAALPDFIGTSHQQTIDALKNFGYFAVAIAKAKTNADLESALSSAALPVGSYRIKRNSFKNFSLNAWAGGFLGTQHFTGTVPPGVKQDNGLGGFTAPLGVAYSWGQVWYSGDNKGKLKGYSNTILLNVIDIGSITAFRLTHDTTAALPDFKWQNILAPGIFYIFGWRNSPLSLGGGVQYGPQLRGFTDNSAIVLPPAISFRLFLAVDIPLFNFYTRTQQTDAPK
ncbi:MAG TPA: hypothetical protein VNU72_00805, partial [Puia sp.]|nr:hypothetical protein [Puia sp.]